MTRAVKIEFVPPHVLELDTIGPLDELNRCLYGRTENEIKMNLNSFGNHVQYLDRETE